MKISKNAQTTARRMFHMCHENGQLSPARVRLATTKLLAERPRDYRGILSALARLVRLDARRRRVIVESARVLDSVAQERIRHSLTEQHGPGLTFDFQANPDLLGGLKIQVGDNVIDGSVKNRLQLLENNFTK